MISDAAGTRLVYATTSWNNGAGPLELRAGDFRQTGPNDYTRDVSQRIYCSDGTYFDHSREHSSTIRSTTISTSRTTPW